MLRSLSTLTKVLSQLFPSEADAARIHNQPHSSSEAGFAHAAARSERLHGASFPSTKAELKRSHIINSQSEIITTAAKRFHQWMTQFHGHDGTHKEELIDWLFCDSGGKLIKTYSDFCALAVKLSSEEYGRYDTTPPPSEADFVYGMKFYLKRYPDKKIADQIHELIKKESPLKEHKLVSTGHHAELCKKLPKTKKIMISYWYRAQGSFYENVKRPTVDRLVIFRNTTITSTIKEIEVYRYNHKRTNPYSICLTPSPFKRDELIHACKTIFNPNEINLSHSDIRIQFNSVEQFNKLIDLFNHLNKNERVEIPWEIIVELTQVFNHLHNFQKDGHHVIVSYEDLNPNINPDRKGSTALITAMNQLENRPTRKDIKKFLARGEDPNQNAGSGWTPAYNAVNSYDDDVVKLLLNYKADPFRRYEGFFFESAIELARRMEKFSTLKLFNETFSTLKRHISSPYKVVSSPTIQLQEEKKQITTSFNFTNGLSIVTRIKPIEILEQKEKNAIKKLFTKFFENPTQGKAQVEKEFDEEFTPDSNGNCKFIETIYALDSASGQETMIGFISSKLLMNVDADPPCHVYVIDYCGIDPKYHHLGLGFILSFRNAFGLQPLLDKLLTIHFSAIDYNSYKLVESMLHEPKYRSEQNDKSKLLNSIMRRAYGNTKYVNDKDSTESYVVDTLRVADSQAKSKMRSSHEVQQQPMMGSGQEFNQHSKPTDSSCEVKQQPKPKMSLGFEFYHQDILGYGEIPKQSEDEIRGGLVVIDVADQLLRKITYLADSLGFNFILHMHELATLLPKIVEPLKDKKPNTPELFEHFPCSSIVFWRKYKTVNLYRPDLTMQSRM